MSSEKAFHRALKWSYVMNWGDQLFTSLIAFLLAAFLGPKDFGLISMAMVYILFVQMLLDQGLVAAIIQRKDLTTEHLDSVFWLVQAVCAVLMVLTIALGKWWAHVNHQPELVGLIWWLSLTIPIESLSVVQKAVLQKNMDFRSLSIRTNVSVIIGGFVGLAMALKGWGVWSLVGQQIVRDCAALVLLWKLAHWRPGFRLSFSRLKELFHFSLANFVAKLGVYTNSQTDVVLMGLLFGPVSVGLYRFAARAMSIFFRVAQFSIMSVSFPEFSRWQDDRPRLRESMLSCIRLCGALTIPPLAGLAATSGLLMAAVGPKWLDAQAGLTVLCITGMFEGFAQFAGPMLQAISRPKLLAVLSWIQTVLSGLLLLLAAYLLRGAPDSRVVVGVSATHFVVVCFVAIPVSLTLLHRFCDITMLDVFRTLKPSILAALATAAVVLLPQRLGLFANWKPLIALSLLALMGGAVGITLILLLDTRLKTMLAMMIPGMAPKES